MVMRAVRDRYLRTGSEVPPELVDEIQRISHPLENPDDLDPLLERIGDARIVMLGEASHGTSEFYTWRTKISRRLIQEKGFNFIGVEGDWPDCYRVNDYVKHRDGHASARDALSEWEHWPTWMWANWEIVDLAEWLGRYNDGRDPKAQVGFYGLDVYSLWDSMDAVIEYLKRVDPSAVEAAQRAYRCFEPYGEDVQEYARATWLVPTTCENEAVQMLADLCDRAGQLRQQDPEGFFNAEQNALIAVNAETYYRTMVRGGSASWNVRDHHMMETLTRLLDHHGPDSKALVWEHNTHIGDARATDMAGAGMVNIGSLARERYGLDQVVLVGFGTYEGTVIAGQEWGAPMEVMQVPPARPGSYEDAMHTAGADDKLMVLTGVQGIERLFDARGNRAIGVVYDPAYEAYGNYVPTILPLRYDAFMFIDRTRALHPLHLHAEPPTHGVMETYPTGY